MSPLAFALLGCYVPVDFTGQLDHLFTLPKFLCVAAGCAWALCGGGGMPRGELRVPLLAVVSAALLSSLAAGSPVLNLLGRTGSTGGGFPGVVLMWLCYEAGLTDRGGGKAARSLAWGAGLTAAAAVLQVAFGAILQNGRAVGLAGSPPFLGVMLALAIPVLAAAPYWPTALFAMVGGALSQSRAAGIGVAAGLAVALPLPRWAKFAGAGLLVLGPLLTVDRLAGDAMRLQAWEVALHAFLDAPLLGVGPEGFTDAFMLLRDPLRWPVGGVTVVEDAHNMFLHVLAAGGLAGAAAWGWLGCRARRVVPASAAAVLAFGLFQPVPWTAWCALAALAGAAEREER